MQIRRVLIILTIVTGGYIKRQDVAQRIRELRGPRPQPRIAAEVGVTLRAYQAWEAGGGIAWPNLEKLAEFHGVTTSWLEHGDAGPGLPRTQLDRIESKLDQLLSRHGAVQVDDLFQPSTDELGSNQGGQRGPSKIYGA